MTIDFDYEKIQIYKDQIRENYLIKKFFHIAEKKFLIRKISNRTVHRAYSINNLKFFDFKETSHFFWFWTSELHPWMHLTTLSSKTFKINSKLLITLSLKTFGKKPVQNFPLFSPLILPLEGDLTTTLDILRVIYGPPQVSNGDSSHHSLSLTQPPHSQHGKYFSSTVFYWKFFSLTKTKES